MGYQHRPQGFSPIWLLWGFPTTKSHKEPHNSPPSTARPSHFPNSQRSQMQPPKSHPHQALPRAAPHTGAHHKQGKEDKPPKARPTEAGAAPTGADAWVEVVESCPISLETSLLPQRSAYELCRASCGAGKTSQPGSQGERGSPDGAGGGEEQSPKARAHTKLWGLYSPAHFSAEKGKSWPGAAPGSSYGAGSRPWWGEKRWCRAGARAQRGFSIPPASACAGQQQPCKPNVPFLRTSAPSIIPTSLP